MRKLNIWLSVLAIIIMVACTEVQLSRDLNGVGPYTEIELEPLNDSLMQQGKSLFDSKCSSCHTMEFKNSGPDISDILAYRREVWVLNFILNKEEMLRRDSLALLTRKEYEMDCGSDISSEEEAFQLLEYLRQYQIWLREFNVR
ncbi:MAG: hypothetical protein CL840_19050 [Crocinitomicaceae bacterium]|nr:hypothetical protein [Crocinitomicaceae bacterium]|tara:strand:- start:10002 stop:10433 length:432 start_codon:yes stop_codon:yes gene_type:complete